MENIHILPVCQVTNTDHPDVAQAVVNTSAIMDVLMGSEYPSYHC